MIRTVLEEYTKGGIASKFGGNKEKKEMETVAYHRCFTSRRFRN
jgi:hypothetical protein